MYKNSGLEYRSIKISRVKGWLLLANGLPSKKAIGKSVVGMITLFGDAQTDLFGGLESEVIKMYMVIYWVGDDAVYPLLNSDSTIKLFEKIGEADDKADEIENEPELVASVDDEVEARVISIEAAKDY